MIRQGDHYSLSQLQWILLLIDKTEKIRGKQNKVKLLEAVWLQAQKGPRYVAPGTDCSPGSDVVNVIQIKILIVILK